MVSDAALHLKRKTWLGPRASDYNLTIEWSNCVSSEHLYSRLLKTKKLFSFSSQTFLPLTLTISLLPHTPKHLSPSQTTSWPLAYSLAQKLLYLSSHLFHSTYYTYLTLYLSMSRKETLSHSGFFLSFIIRLFSLSLLIFLPHTLKTNFSPTL